MDTTRKGESCSRVRVRSDGARVTRVVTVRASAHLPAALAALEHISAAPPTIVDVSSLHDTGRFDVSIEVASGTRYRLSVSDASD